MPPPKKGKDVVGVGSFKAPKTKDIPSWIQFTSANLAKWLLAFLCVLTLAFVIIWTVTVPSIADLQISGRTEQIDLDKVFERFYAARRSHFNDIRDMYLLVMGTTLAPALSLLFGHAFGQAQERARADEASENA